MKKKRIIMIVAILLVLLVLQSLPVIFKKPLNCKTMSNKYIKLYYQSGDEKGAGEVFELLTNRSEEICRRLQFERKAPIKVYLYSTQSQLAIREAGFITLTFAPSWYIGDSHNGTILMVSPYTKVKDHTHDSILNATLHELVHSINYYMNDKLSYFWDNGLATYLAEQKPQESDYSNREIPSLEDLHTENGIKFGTMGGYAFSYKYIEYIDQTYGWDKVLEYVKGAGSYEEVFGKTEEELYRDWCKSLKQ